MTIRAYKTLRFGPFHITLSRSGVSTSVGDRKARVGKRSNRRGVRQSIKLPGGYRLRKN